MSFIVEYHNLVVKDDIPKLSTVWRKRVRFAIEEKLMAEPEIFGRPLRRSLKGYRKLRVGDYRIVFRIEGKTVKIFAIQHRSIVYRTIGRRQ